MTKLVGKESGRGGVVSQRDGQSWGPGCTHSGVVGDPIYPTPSYAYAFTYMGESPQTGSTHRIDEWVLMLPLPGCCWQQENQSHNKLLLKC